MKQVCAHVTLSGQVQGVSFRYLAKQKAQQLGVTGWIKNGEHGEVEAIFEGPETSVNRMLSWCRSGSPGHVSGAEVTFEPPRNQENFKITR